MAEILLTQRAIRDLDRLDQPLRQRILKKLQTLAADPLNSARKLANARIGSFRYRIGRHRVIFDFEDDQIIVLRIGDRKEIYS